MLIIELRKALKGIWSIVYRVAKLLPQGGESVGRCRFRARAPDNGGPRADEEAIGDCCELPW